LSQQFIIQSCSFSLVMYIISTFLKSKKSSKHIFLKNVIITILV